MTGASSRARALLLAAVVGLGCPGEPPARPPIASSVSSETEQAEESAAAPDGRRRRAPGSPGGGDGGLSERRQLEALGYLDGYEKAGERAGVTRIDADAVQEGANFLTSGHGPEALLMDERGEVLHRWLLPFEVAFPGVGTEGRGKGPNQWRRAHLYENGDVLAIFEGLGIIRIDRNSELVWARANGAHHDMDVLEDGRIVVLTRTRAPHAVLSRRGEPIWQDAVTFLSPEGAPLGRVSVLDAVLASARPKLVDRLRGRQDPLHTNSVEVLDERITGVDGLRAGNLLVSFRKTDTIAAIDPVAGEVVWTLQGSWDAQHEATVVGKNRILLFDNNPPRKQSAVLDLDPSTGTVLWSFVGSPREPFYTPTCGVAQRLGNGNTLVTESNAGRAFEVTRDGRVVWEFISPHRAGKDRELTATLFEVQRIPPDFPLGWAQGRR